MPPAIWSAASASPWIAQATSVASTGSSVATTPTRAAGRWRSALTLSRNGPSVPITTTPSASAALRALPKSSNGNVHGGLTSSQKSVAKPRPQVSVVNAS